MMQVFLGDQVTLVNESHDEEQPTFITGQVKGIILTESKKVERIYVHNLDNALWMSQGWKFVDSEDDDVDLD